MSVSPLAEYQIREYMPAVFEKVIDNFSIPLPYKIIYQAAKEFEEAYQELVPSLTDAYSVNTIAGQIKSGKLDTQLKKVFMILEANFGIKIDFNQFKTSFYQEFSTISRMSAEIIAEYVQTYKIIRKMQFGNLRKLVQSKEFDVQDDKMNLLYPQMLDAYTRILILIEEKNENQPLIDRIKLFSSIRFYENEDELQAHYEKNKSLLEAVYAVQKLENISIMTRFFCEGSNIDVSMIAKEALVTWRNEYSDLTKQAKEEKRLRKEDARKKKLYASEQDMEFIYNEIAPRFLLKKSLKEIIIEIKDKFPKKEDKLHLGEIMKSLLPVEEEFISILLDPKPEKYFKNFNKNQYEDRPLLYLAILYKSLIDNNMDFLNDVIKNLDDPNVLRLGARKILYIKMIQNTKVKNPLGESRVIGFFLSSFERIILNENETLDFRKDNVIKLAVLSLYGVPELSDDFDTLLGDLFIKVFSALLDVNLINRFANLKKMSDKESEMIELLKESLKWYEVVVRELGKREGKSRDQARRNDFLLGKLDRKLSSSAKKIKEKAVLL